MVARLAEGVTVACGARVDAVVRDHDGGGWGVHVGGAVHRVDAVVVTVPIGVLHRGTLRFDPPLPERVVAAAGRIGAGRVAKVFVTFDSAFWAPARAFHVIDDPAPALPLWVDVSAAMGRPTLCAFATGDHAEAVEALDEAALCALAAATLPAAF